MINKVSKLKISFITGLMLMVTACSNNMITSQSEQTIAVDPEIAEAQKQQDQQTAWQQSYGEKQEATENTLSEQTAQIEADLWQRVRNGFVMTPALPLNKPTQKELNRFLKSHRYLDKLAERAEPYLHHIVTELEKRNMPMELALLPAVESGFKPQVYSRSGAAGIWQFMPATGKVFGLQQNWWYDGRRDIVASTDAALTYLQKLYGYFGDWQLAIAAYNAGEGTVGRAIKKNKAAGKATDFWSLSLPKETTHYVPKLMAVSHLVLQPHRYDRRLPTIANKPVFEVIEVGSQMDLTMAAELANLSHDRLHQFNPGFNQWATAPNGPHYLAIPLDNAARFRQKLVSLTPEQRMYWQRHKIKHGESLGLIAKRYKTTIAVVKKANKLTSSRIRAGKYLIIPTPNKSQLAKVQTKPNNLKKVVPEQGKKRIHIVKKGDTLWDLSMAYKVGVRQLAQWNGKRTTDTLSLGQQLVVWSVPKPAELANRKKVHYEIRQGDSLWKISQQFNVSVAQVKEWNGLSSRALLQPGQRLKLYIDKSS